MRGFFLHNRDGRDGEVHGPFHHQNNRCRYGNDYDHRGDYIIGMIIVGSLFHAYNDIQRRGQRDAGGVDAGSGAEEGQIDVNGPIVA